MSEAHPIPKVLSERHKRTLNQVLTWTGHPRRCPLCGVFHRHECDFQNDVRSLLEWLFEEGGIARLREYLDNSS